MTEHGEIDFFKNFLKQVKVKAQKPFLLQGSK